MENLHKPLSRISEDQANQTEFKLCIQRFNPVTAPYENLATRKPRSVPLCTAFALWALNNAEALVSTAPSSKAFPQLQRGHPAPAWSLPHTARAGCQHVLLVGDLSCRRWPKEESWGGLTRGGGAGEGRLRLKHREAHLPGKPGIKGYRFNRIMITEHIIISCGLKNPPFLQRSRVEGAVSSQKSARQSGGTDAASWQPRRLAVPVHTPKCSTRAAQRAVTAGLLLPFPTGKEKSSNAMLLAQGWNACFPPENKDKTNS